MLTSSSVSLAGYVFFCLIIVVWNVTAAGRIARDRRAPTTFTIATAIGALLLIPALVTEIATASIVYGRGIQPLGWLWPAVTIVFLIQATLGLVHRLANPLVGIPVLFYNLAIAIVAIARYMAELGLTPPQFMLVASAAQADALGIVAGPSALWNAAWILIPLVAPALPSRSRVKGAVRGALALGVMAATAVIIIAVPRAIETIRSYDRFTNQSPQERPAGDFDIGLQIFPELRDAPPAIAINYDVPLVDSLGVDAVSIVVAPEALRLKTLDSLASTVDQFRNDSTILIVALSYPKDARRALLRSQSNYIEARLRDVDRIARALKPTVLIPAYEPYGAGERALGTLQPPFWTEYISRSARIVRHVNPNIKIGLSAASYGPRDSALYAWAARRSSPVDWLGFSLMPEAEGGKTLETHLRIAQRWMRLYPPVKPHWVWSAGGYPVTHGEQSQQLALRGVFAWATSQPAITGIIVTESGDYDAQLGLRAPSGRLRVATSELNSSIESIRESSGQ